MPRIPTAGKSDAAIERRAHEISEIVTALTTVQPSVADVATTLAAPAIQVHDTERTSALPGREIAGHVTHADRARAMGGASSEVASYPVLDGAPVGKLETWNQLKRALSQEQEAIRMMHRGARGLPGSKRAKRIARAAKHNAKVKGA